MKTWLSKDEYCKNAVILRIYVDSLHLYYNDWKSLQNCLDYLEREELLADEKNAYDNLRLHCDAIFQRDEFKK